MSEEIAKESPTTTTTTAKKAKAKRLTPAEWMDAKIKWRSGQYTLPQLSEIFGISDQALWKRFKRHGIKRAEDAETYEAEIEQRQLEEAAEAIAARDKRRRERAGEIEDFVLESIHAINRSVMSSASAALKNRQPLATIHDDVKTGKELALMLKNNVETAKKIIGEDKIEEEELPTLRVMTLTDQDQDDIERKHKEEEAMFTIVDEDDDDIIDDIEDATESSLNN